MIKRLAQNVEMFNVGTKNGDMENYEDAKQVKDAAFDVLLELAKFFVMSIEFFRNDTLRGVVSL
jgi:hypothetical protein